MLIGSDAYGAQPDAVNVQITRQILPTDATISFIICHSSGKVQRRRNHLYREC